MIPVGWKTAAAALLAGAVASIAQAEVGDDDTPDITGAWLFQTAPLMDGACEFRGEMDIQPDPQTPGAYTCRFTTAQTCVDDTVYTSEQVCTAAMRPSSLVIVSEVIAVKPQAAFERYYRDNFVLRELSSSRMAGFLTSLDTAKVEFWRDTDAIS